MAGTHESVHAGLPTGGTVVPEIGGLANFVNYLFSPTSLSLSLPLAHHSFHQLYLLKLIMQL